MADSDPNFEALHGWGYLRPRYDDGKFEGIQGCALGGIVTRLIPKKSIKEYADWAYNSEDFDREGIIEKICGKIKGSCDQVPIKIWKKLLPGDKYLFHEWDVYPESTRWVDLVERLYENKNKTFKQIAKILKRYDK